ncbi:MAG: Coq4 family protein [Cyanobacteria bacterium P01_A01_bin.84]
MNKLNKIKKALYYQRVGKIGDFALLKADFLGARLSPEIVDKLENVVGYYPKIDLDELITYPPNSFGREYAEHMKSNNLQTLDISPELDDIAQGNVFALRYLVTHDIFHVLLGFDTSYAGEIGVLAFAVAQNYSKSQNLSIWLAKFIYPILAPKEIPIILSNLKKGKEIGKNAKFLLGYRFEEHWHEPINEVRKNLELLQ